MIYESCHGGDDAGGLADLTDEAIVVVADVDIGGIGGVYGNAMRIVKGGVLGKDVIAVVAIAAVARDDGDDSGSADLVDALLALDGNRRCCPGCRSRFHRDC